MRLIVSEARALNASEMRIKREKALLLRKRSKAPSTAKPRSSPATTARVGGSRPTKLITSTAPLGDITNTNGSKRPSGILGKSAATTMLASVISTGTKRRRGGPREVITDAEPFPRAEQAVTEIQHVKHSKTIAKSPKDITYGPQIAPPMGSETARTDSSSVPALGVGGDKSGTGRDNKKALPGTMRQKMARVRLAKKARKERNAKRVEHLLLH